MRKFSEVGNEKVYVNFLDVDFKKRYFDELKKLHDNISNIDLDSTDEIEALSNMIDQAKMFFDAVWEEGTFDKIFEGRKDLDAIYDVLMKITDMKDEQETAFALKCAEYTGKVLGENNESSN